MATHPQIRLLVAPAAVAVTLLSGTPATAANAGAFPVTIHSAPMTSSDAAALPRGTAVKAADVTQRVSLGGAVRAGLGDRGSLDGSVYPVISTDGGKRWRIDGPLFYRAAADAPNVTNRLEALGTDTLIAWGSGGNFVKTSTDRGAHWYAANFPVGVYSAGVQATHLVVRAMGNPDRASRFPTRRYTSTDGGRVWHRGAQLGSVRY